MPEDDHKQSKHFDAAMPVPDDSHFRSASSSDDKNDDAHTDDHDTQDAAADLVRQKIDSLFLNAPAPQADDSQVNMVALSQQSKHQKFIDELINSGKSLPEIQEAWHEYYAGLPDQEKHQVWQEFYAEHERKSSFNPSPAVSQPTTIAQATKPRRKRLASPSRRYKRFEPKTRADRPQRAASPVRSLAFGLSMGALVILIFLFSFFNERFIAPFIQPSRTVTNTPIINDNSTIGANPEIVIPKINVQIPVVYNVNTIDSDTVENALEGGVVHYADTALPGQDGNLVIVGHSSNNIFNQGKYKFAFVLLSRMQNGDTFYLDKDGVRYTYQVYQKEIVNPTDVSVLGPQGKPATATLITCDPPGTSTNRLVVVGQQISPSTTANVAASGSNSLATKAAIIPGNSPTLWSRLVSWFKT